MTLASQFRKKRPPEACLGFPKSKAGSVDADTWRPFGTSGLELQELARCFESLGETQSNAETNSRLVRWWIDDRTTPAQVADDRTQFLNTGGSLQSPVTSADRSLFRRRSRLLQLAGVLKVLAIQVFKFDARQLIQAGRTVTFLGI